MVKNAVLYLRRNPSVLTLLKEGKASLTGLTEIERQAVMKVIQDDKPVSRDAALRYWK